LIRRFVRSELPRKVHPLVYVQISRETEIEKKNCFGPREGEVTYFENAYVELCQERILIEFVLLIGDSLYILGAKLWGSGTKWPIIKSCRSLYRTL
jgi:hypothetical protein